MGQQGQERMRGRALPHLASRRPGTQRKTEPGAEGMARGPAEVRSVKGWVAGQWLREEKAKEVSDLGRSFCVVCPAKKKETDGRGGAEEPLRGANSWRWACGMPMVGCSERRGFPPRAGCHGGEGDRTFHVAEGPAQVSEAVLRPLPAELRGAQGRQDGGQGCRRAEACGLPCGDRSVALSPPPGAP